MLAISVITFIWAMVSDRYQTIQQETAPVETEQVQIAQIYTGQIFKNSSLYAELLKQEVPRAVVAQITARFAELFDLSRSRPGDEYKLFVTPGDTVMAFEYLTRDLKIYRLEKSGEDFIEQVSDVDLEKRIEFAGTVIESSLWDALAKELPDMELFTKITDIYAWEIDFLTEPRIGDKFKMVYEAFYKDGKFVKSGEIIAAEYDLDGTPHRAFLFTDPVGYTDYYDENGYSLRRALLKSPLNYRRITSRFSYNRLHPIKKIHRPHLGVDYAASIGTPVVAAGDGIIKVMHWENGFGNYIEIKHDFGLTTTYGHLNEFAKGIGEGRRIRQGEVIGYVGQTGLSTGPHLDYRVKKNGSYVDPLKMTVPAAIPVKSQYMAAFTETVAQGNAALTEQVNPRLYVMNQ